jgi:crossover junction endodeoxyribonuclease RusA
MIKLILPYPPSVNTYWGFSGSRRFLTKKANEFKRLCKTAFVASNQNPFGLERLSITIHLNPPDRRARDIDNVVKSLLDALGQAGLFVDDSQIDVLCVYRHEPVKGGECRVILLPIL